MAEDPLVTCCVTVGFGLPVGSTQPNFVALTVYVPGSRLVNSTQPLIFVSPKLGVGPVIVTRARLSAAPDGSLTCAWSVAMPPTGIAMIVLDVGEVTLPWSSQVADDVTWR